MIKVGIVGGESKVANELIALLLIHPDVELSFVESTANAGEELVTVHKSLVGDTELTFMDHLLLDEIDLLYVCLEKGKAKAFIKNTLFPVQLKIIDLSGDFKQEQVANKFIYGLPELNRREICHGSFVANPGALASSIVLTLLPLAKHLLLKDLVALESKVGAMVRTIEGMDSSSLLAEQNEKTTRAVFKKTLLKEVEQSILHFQKDFKAKVQLDLLPSKIDRSISTTLVMKSEKSLEELYQLYSDYYATDSFVYLTDYTVDEQQAVYTNKFVMHLQKNGDELCITSSMDGVLKGTCGQAIHNMNLLFNLEESVGLRLKGVMY